MSWLAVLIPFACCGLPVRPIPDVQWQPLPADFQPSSLAEAGGTLLIGGMKAGGVGAVLQGHLDRGAGGSRGRWPRATDGSACRRRRSSRTGTPTPDSSAPC